MCNKNKIIFILKQTLNPRFSPNYVDAETNKYLRFSHWPTWFKFFEIRVNFVFPCDRKNTNFYTQVRLFIRTQMYD